MNDMKLVLLVLIMITFFSSCSTSNQEKALIKNNYNNEQQTLQSCEASSFTDQFSFPTGLNGYFDLDEGIKCSKIVSKPCLIYFSAFSSVESRKVEMNLLLNKEIQSFINNEFVFVSLIKDAKMRLPKKYQVISNLKKDTIQLYGEKSKYQQESKFKSNEHPAFYIIGSNEKILTKPYFYDLSIPLFKQFLNEGVLKYEKLLKE